VSRVDERAAPPRAPEPPRRPRLGPVGWARWAWRSLTSMRTALVLLFLLALAAVPGSLLPQRGPSPSRVAAYERDHPTAFRALDALSMFDVYASPWFSAVYLLLFVSLVGCVLPRGRQHWHAVRARPPAAPRRLDRLPAHRRFGAQAPPEDVLAAARATLRARRYRVDVSWDSVAAERGHARETGNLLFHLALLVILVGVAVGHLFGFRGDVVVVEGDGFPNVVAAYDSVDPGPRFDERRLEPFTLAVDRFTVRYQEGGQQSGAPREFRAAVRVRPRPDAPERRAVIASNRPLVVGGSKVFLTGNGYAPRITVRDGRGRVVSRGPVPFLPQDGNMASTGVVKVPDARPAQLGVDALFLPTAVVDPVRGPISVFPDARTPRLFLTVWKGDLGLDDGVPESVYRLDTSALKQLRDPADPSRPLAAALRPGQTLTLPDRLGSVTFDGVDRFVNLHVARNPGKVPALAGAALALAGLLVSLYVRRRRMWVRASADGDGRTVVEVAGLARSEADAVGAEVDAVTDDLRGRLREKG